MVEQNISESIPARHAPGGILRVSITTMNKPESVDDGSLEKLAEKAVLQINTVYCSYDQSRIDEEPLRIIFSALSEATAALEAAVQEEASLNLDKIERIRTLGEKIKKLESANATNPIPQEIVISLGQATSFIPWKYSRGDAFGNDHHIIETADLPSASIVIVRMVPVTKNEQYNQAVEDDFRLIVAAVNFAKRLALQGVEKVGDKQPRTMAQQKD